MKEKNILSWSIFLVLIILLLAQGVIAEVLYVDSQNGNDTNPGNKEKPLLTIGKAADVVNGKKEPGPTTIKLAPGVYTLVKPAIFENKRTYTEKDRFTITATILPGDKNWHPSKMPIILSTAGPSTSKGMWQGLPMVDGIDIEISHVTIRGLRFVGNPRSDVQYYAVRRYGDLDDLVVTQCLFLGEEHASRLHVGIITGGKRLVVDHCIFYRCHDTFVLFGGTGFEFKYCIMNEVYAAIWTCGTESDLQFHHNVVTNCDLVHMHVNEGKRKYTFNDCIITNNKKFSNGRKYISYNLKNVVEKGQVVLVNDRRKIDNLHPVSGTLGSDLGAGLFKK